MDQTSIHFLKKASMLRQVVELGGLRPVAQHNKVSISAISQAISGLEKALDRKLFVRANGRLSPTQHCVRLLESAAPAFEALEEFRQVFHPAEQIPPPIAWLDFGVSHCIASDLLPRLVKSLKEEIPEMRLKLRTGRCRSLIDAIKKGKLCMALVAADEIPKGVSAYPVFEERLGIYFPSDRACPPEALREGRFAGVAAEPDGQPLYYTRFLRSIGAVSAPTVVCDSYESLYDIAVAGVLPAVLPERLAARARGALRKVEPSRVSDSAKCFTVYLLSQKACDPEEDRFLLRELRSLL